MGVVFYITQRQINAIINELTRSAHAVPKEQTGYETPALLNDDSATINGTLLTGVDKRPALKSRLNMNIRIIITSLAGIAAFVCIIVFSNRVIMKRANLSEKQMSQQILIAKISRSFLSDIDTDTLITETLKMTGNFMNLQQVLFFKLGDDGVTLTCRNEWANPDLKLASRIKSTITLHEPMLSAVRSINAGSPADSHMSSNNLTYRDLMAPYRVNFNSFITTPVYIKGKICAVIDFANNNNNKKWTESDINLAMLCANILSGVFEREAMGRRTSIVENSPHIIFYSDSNGNLVYANRALSAVCGYSKAEIKKGGFNLLFDSLTICFIRDISFPKIKQSGMARYESILKCKDGRKRTLDITSFIMKDEIIASIAMDLTEIRALQAELVNAKNRAEQANRAKGEFLANISHEMRAPINAITGMTAIGKNSADIERKNYSLNKIGKASTHLLGIINDVLDISMIETNNLTLNSSEFELKNLLQKSVSFVHFFMEEKRHRFTIHVDDNVPFFCLGDDQRLTQIITNLLTNAVKSTPEDGEISLMVSLLKETNNICDVRFIVADSGTGISAQQQERIFRMFEQTESGAARKFAGTGLGLSVSKRIIELMGGTIAVESKHGEGSRFIFTVKLVRTNKDTGIRFLNKDEIYAKDKDYLLTGKKILLAEDLEINREILVSLLDGTGLVIDTAQDGRQALEKITGDYSSYDLIFMDMQTPEMDGFETARKIRNYESRRQNKNSIPGRIPIIAMTANVLREDIDNCLAAGMDDYIGKPIDIFTVFEKLRKYI
jgi:PAS domain S-box-containing protein